MPTNTIMRYVTLVGVLITLAAAVLWVIPKFMETPFRNAVQSVAKTYTGNPYLFGFNPTASVNEIIEGVLQNKSGRITREDAPKIVAEVINLYRPDFSKSTMQFVVEAAFNLAVGSLPPVISDPQVLTPILSAAIPMALSSLGPSKLPPKYPGLAEILFKNSVWMGIAVAAAVIGLIALIFGQTRKIICPRDEMSRTKIVNAMIVIPYILSLSALFYFLFTFKSAAPDAGIFSSPQYIGVTSWIFFSFLVASIAIYFGVTLTIYLLPYFVARINILAVWRRLFFPPLTNLIGDLLHRLKTSEIMMHFAKMLFKQFAREMAP